MNIQVNGVDIYYEVYGQGEPLILLHGNQESHDIFDKLIPNISREYTVYAIDSRCHGKSQKTKEISYELMTDDVISFIKELNLNKPIIYGFSDGGIVALLIAIKEKELLSRIIISGANVTPDGVAKLDYIITKFVYFFTRDKRIEMMLYEPNITDEELESITIPVNIIVGEKDVIKKEHTEYISEHIKDSTLKILKDENHGSYVIHNEKLYNILKNYI